MRKRKNCSPEFKREAVEQTRRPGVSCRQVGIELGINARFLSCCRREADATSTPSFQGSGSPRDAELARLKRELARVKKERDFLREAATFFAKESS